MRFMRRIRELFSTLRVRLVAWIIVIVVLMVVLTNLTVREVEQESLRANYDDFLKVTLDDVGGFLASKAELPLTFDAILREKRKVYEYRNWFLTIFDVDHQLIWSSENAPAMAFQAFANDAHGPYDSNRHRILTSRIRNANHEVYFVRCGFPKSALQDDIELLNRNIFIVTVCILLTAPLGGYVIALRATRPISNIIQSAAQLQPSNLDQRLPIQGTGDELDQLSQTINGMLDRIASYVHQHRDFIANAAHELRSPLAAIRSSVEVTIERERTPAEYDHLLVDVMEEVTRLSGLINRLLLLAETDGDRTSVPGHVTHLDRIVRESVDMFDGVAEFNSVRLSTGKAMASAVVPGEETYLRQVVRNLIDNAIKYNRPEGEVIVNLEVDSGRCQAVLTIADTGIGMDDESLSRAFERFYRVDRSRSREKGRGGYGLGLSICQTIVQSLGGEIAVESVLGRGSRFTVRLPLASEPRTQ